MKPAMLLRDFLIAVSRFSLSFSKVLVLSRFRTKIPEKSGNEIAVFANGPSLNEAIEKMRSEGMPENIVVTNFFCKSDLYTDLKPNFYVICDPVFTSLSDDMPAIREFYIQLFEKTTWELTFFIPFRYRKAIRRILDELQLSNPNIRFNYYNNVNFNGDHWFNYLFFQWKLGMPRPTTVAVPALMMCLHMGYKTIKIAGIDLNQHQDIVIDKDNRLMIRSKHFYSQQETLVPFFKNRKENKTFSSSEIFLIFHNFFYSFDIIAKFARRQQIAIINYSEASFLDQFKKV